MRKWEFCHANGDLDLTRETGAAMTDVRDQGRALGDRTRYAIFETLRDAAGPLTVAQLAAQFTLHPNAIRLHLGKLRDASLVIEETAAPRGRGGRRCFIGSAQAPSSAGSPLRPTRSSH